MKKSLGITLLAIYLIVIGAVTLFGINLGVISFVPPVLAIAAGVCLLIGK